MAILRAAALVCAQSWLLQVGAAEEPILQVADLVADDQCDAGDAQCALNAMQLRARRTAVDGAAAAHGAAAAADVELASSSRDEEPGKCAGPWGTCTENKCCSGGAYACYAKDETYGQCLPDGGCTKGIHMNDGEGQRTPWSCELLSTPSAAAAGPPKWDPEEPVVAADYPVNPVVTKGNFLYDSVTGKRFFAKGVAYNPRNINYKGVTEGPKSKTCKAGEPKFQTLSYTADVTTDDLEHEWGPSLEAIANLSANTIRLYNINPTYSHKKFMRKAAELGLYVIVPLTRMDWGYLPAFPSPDCYTMELEGYGNVGVNLLTSAKLIVKQFSAFSNTILFTVANEMPVNDKNGFAAFPCVKALTRDVHRFQADCKSNMRRVPLIYSDMDMGSPTRVHIANYLSCELESPDDAVDAYGLNVYSWCDSQYLDETGVNNFKYSPYDAIKEDFDKFEKPLIFSEFGCNTGEFETVCPYNKGRNWVDVPAMFENMGEVLSGAVAFEFSMEKNQYGLVLTPGFLKGQKEMELLDNYFALQKQYSSNNISDRWDGIDVQSCSALPSDAAPLSFSHPKSVCPGKAVWQDLQEKRGVDKVGDWDVLPPTPDAPLVAVNNQTECMEVSKVSATALKETCCHVKCSAE